MHDTAYRIGALVMDTYLPSTPAKILEIGAQDVNGTLRDHAPRNAQYVGLDFDEGAGVDIVVTDVTDWGVPDSHFDLVIASSVFEHDKAFWRTFIAMCNKARPGGHIYVSAPSNGTVHRYPKDYWRFYPDSGLALEEWARSEGLDVTLVESFVAEREAEVWNDYCAVFRRGPSDERLNRDFVCDKVSAHNALTWRSPQVINPVDDTQDTRLLVEARAETQRWVRHAEHLDSEFSLQKHSWEAERERLKQEIETQTNRIAEIDRTAALKGDQLAMFEASANNLQLELDRLNAEVEARTEEHEENNRNLASGLSELQSRLAQREEEAAQAWATADERERERERLAAELEKVGNKLADANAWVERLALTRAKMERSVGKLEKALARASKDFAREQQRNGLLEDRIATLTEHAGGEGQSTGNDDNAPEPVQDAAAEAVRQALEAAHRAREAELAQSRMRLQESREDVASLSNMVAEAQDHAADLERQNAWLRDVSRLLLERGKWWWRFMPLAWQSKRRDRKLLRSGLFDSEVYANRYPDVVSSGQEPFRHYLHHGVTENRRFD